MASPQTPLKSVIKSNIKLPFFISRIAAGFPSPADDHVEKHLDLNEYLIQKPAATFYVKVVGDSMKDAGIFNGDLLVVDRSKTAKHGSVVLAIVNGEFTVKRLVKKAGKIFLKAENENFAPLEILEEMDFEIWGVAIHVVHSLK